MRAMSRLKVSRRTRMPMSIDLITGDMKCPGGATGGDKTDLVY